MEVYRIVHKRWSKKLVASGNEARWNSSGRFVIYTSASRALACLENIVHRSGEGLSELFKTMVIEISLKVSLERLDRKKLPSNWENIIHYPVTQQLGDEWLVSGRTAVLQIPSAIIPEEFNFLINPGHRDFKKIKLQRVEEFKFDHRVK